MPGVRRTTTGFSLPRGAAWRRVSRKRCGIVANGPHRIGGEELGEDPVQEVAVLQHVGHAARAAAVVLEDEVLAAVVADEVGAHDVGVDPTAGGSTPSRARLNSTRE